MIPQKSNDTIPMELSVLDVLRCVSSSEHTRQVHTMREEVGGVRDEDNKAALNVREPSDVGDLEQQCRQDTNDNADNQTTEEDKQEDAGGLKEAENAVAGRLPLFVLLGGFENNNGNSIVEDRFTEDDGIELRVDFVSVEDGEDCDGIGSRECSPDGNGIDEAEIQRAGQQSEEPQDQANNDG